MVDVAVEILSCSVPVPRENIIFIVKTWWTQVEVDGKQIYVKLPVLPMIEQFYRMKAKKNYVFVEVWYVNEELFPPGTRRFLGMAKSLVDNLLAHPQASPCMEWLDVFDPIEDLTRGKMLLKVHAHFSSDKEPSLSSPAKSSNSVATSRLYSSYFGAKKDHMPGSSVESSPFSTRSIPVQTENEEDAYNNDKPTPDIPSIRSVQNNYAKPSGSRDNRTDTNNRQLDQPQLNNGSSRGHCNTGPELIVTGKSCLSSRDAPEIDYPESGLKTKLTRNKEQNHNVKFSESTAFSNTTDSVRQIPGSSKGSRSTKNNIDIDTMDLNHVDDVIEIMKNLDGFSTLGKASSISSEEPDKEDYNNVRDQNLRRNKAAQNLREASAKLQKDWKEYLAKRNNDTPMSTTRSQGSNSISSSVMSPAHNADPRLLLKKYSESKGQTPFQDENRTEFSTAIKPTPISSELDFSTKTKTARNENGTNGAIERNIPHLLPPRSKRIAAAIYNNYPDGLGN